MIKNNICEIFGIEYPIFQGGMAWVSDASLAAGVSNAGGLGIIAAGNAPASVVHEQIKLAKKLTNKPFGVNVMLMSPFVDDVMEVIYEEKVSMITTGAGNPGKYIPKLKELGIKIVPVVPSVALAKKMEKSGVDAVIAEGTESGGHVGELTTMVLVPQVADVLDIPVIAAGGIGDRRGVVAAFALGAVGVQLGTRFLCSNECTVHDNYKQLIIKSKDRDAIVSGRITGHPVRVIKNKLTRQFEELENNGCTKEEIEELGIGKLKLAAKDGDVEMGSVMAGQIAGMMCEIKSCKQIIEELFNVKPVIENVNRAYSWR